MCYVNLRGYLINCFILTRTGTKWKSNIVMRHFQRYFKTLGGLLKHYVVHDRVRDPDLNMQECNRILHDDTDPNLQVSMIQIQADLQYYFNLTDQNKQD